MKHLLPNSLAWLRYPQRWQNTFFMFLLLTHIFQLWFFGTHHLDISWDSAAYKICADSLYPGSNLNFHAHRPPLFPFLRFLFGSADGLLHLVTGLLLFSMLASYLHKRFSPSVSLLALTILVLSEYLRAYYIINMTEHLSAFLVLWMFIATVEKKWWLTGLIIGLAVLTRWNFLTFVVGVPLVIIVVDRSVKTAIKVMLSSSAVICSYLLIAKMQFGGFLIPLSRNLAINKQTLPNGLTAFQPTETIYQYLFYLISLFEVLGIFAGAVLGVVFIRVCTRFIKNHFQPTSSLEREVLIATLLVLGLLAAQTYLPNKIVRYAVPLIPLMIICLAYGATIFTNSLQEISFPGCSLVNYIAAGLLLLSALRLPAAFQLLPEPHSHHPNGFYFRTRHSLQLYDSYQRYNPLRQFLDNRAIITKLYSLLPPDLILYTEGFGISVQAALPNVQVIRIDGMDQSTRYNKLPESAILLTKQVPGKNYNIVVEMGSILLLQKQ